MNKVGIYYLIKCLDECFLLNKDDRIMALSWHESKMIVEYIREEIRNKGKSIVSTTKGEKELHNDSDVQIVDMNIVNANKGHNEEKWDTFDERKK